LWRGSILSLRFFACFNAFASAFSLALVPGITFGVPTGDWDGATDTGVGLGETNGALGEGVGLGEVVSVRGRAKASSAPNPKSRKPDIRTTPKRLTRHRLPITTVAPPSRDSLLIRFITHIRGRAETLLASGQDCYGNRTSLPMEDRARRSS
jgi:hypothetical protein